MKAAIIGATGYGGAELIRILHNHPHVSIHSVHATSELGKSLSKNYPHMKSIIEKNIEKVNIEKISKEVDVVFTATPSGVSMTMAEQFINAGVKVIDLSGDFRIKNKDIYKAWYGIEQAESDLLKQAVYGLTEWVEEDFSKINLISNPGCFPTSILLGLAPVVKTCLVDPKSIIIDAKTGVSGAGKGLSQATHYAETNDNFKAYKINQHQHTPEIEEKINAWNENSGCITFTPHLAPMTRGIMSTMYMTATEEVTEDELIDVYKEIYKNDFFVRIRDKGDHPTTKDVSGSNFCDISITYDERTNRITIVSVIDNLVKGASGQAVQNMNKLFGYDEKTGIDFMPLFP